MWISCRFSGASEKTRGGEFQAANINLREDAQRSWLHGFLSNIPSYPAIPHRRFLERRPLERGSQRAEVVKRLLLGLEVCPEALSISHRRVLVGCFSTHCLYARGSFPFDISNSSEVFSTTRIPGKQREIGRIYLAYWEKPRWWRHRYGKMRLQSAEFYLDIRLRD